MEIDDFCVEAREDIAALLTFQKALLDKNLIGEGNKRFAILQPAIPLQNSGPAADELKKIARDLREAILKIVGTDWRDGGKFKEAVFEDLDRVERGIRPGSATPNPHSARALRRFGGGGSGSGSGRANS